MNKKKETIFISKEIIKKLKEEIDGDEFKDISEYVEYILSQIVHRLEKQKNKNSVSGYSKEEQEEIEKRLKSLGYK